MEKSKNASATFPWHSWGDVKHANTVVWRYAANGESSRITEMDFRKVCQKWLLHLFIFSCEWGQETLQSYFALALIRKRLKITSSERTIVRRICFHLRPFHNTFNSIYFIMHIGGLYGTALYDCSTYKDTGGVHAQSGYLNIVGVSIFPTKQWDSKKYINKYTFQSSPSHICKLATVLRMPEDDDFFNFLFIYLFFLARLQSLCVARFLEFYFIKLSLGHSQREKWCVWDQSDAWLRAPPRFRTTVLIIHPSTSTQSWLLALSIGIYWAYFFFLRSTQTSVSWLLPKVISILLRFAWLLLLNKK